jgi:hypothetical protein
MLESVDVCLGSRTALILKEYDKFLYNLGVHTGPKYKGSRVNLLAQNL